MRVSETLGVLDWLADCVDVGENEGDIEGDKVGSCDALTLCEAVAEVEGD